jgi:hypothetical protein
MRTSRYARALWALLALGLLAGVAGAVVRSTGGPAPRRDVSTGSTTAPTPPAKACPAPSPRIHAEPVTRVAGTVRTYRVDSVPDGKTYDLRGTRIVGFPASNLYPLLFGKRGPGQATCVLGGAVAGQQPRDLTWQVMKRTLDGDGLHFKSDGGVVDGVRIDNVQDGIGTIGGDPAGITIRNAHLSYIRDDCIENDAIVGLTVKDSLLDGCFAGVSERPGRGARARPAPPGETVTLDGVLLRLQPMPYERSEATCGGNAAGGRGHSGFFKWSPFANRLVVRNTILMAERDSVNCSRSMNLPGNSSYENVTLVWLGSGRYPGKVPASGVRVTRDRSVWDRARADWLVRHGYPVAP